MKMFKIIRNVDSNHRIELHNYLKEYKTKEYPNFSVVVSTHEKLEIGTYFILKNNDDNSFWYGEWSTAVDTYGGSSYTIRKINNINEFLKHTCFLTIRSESIFNSDFYYKINISNYNTGRLNILDYDRYDLYKFPTSECLRYWMTTTTFMDDVERDEKYLTDLYTLNKESDAYKNYKKTYNGYDWFKQHKLDTTQIKRDIKLIALLDGTI